MSGRAGARGPRDERPRSLVLTGGGAALIIGEHNFDLGAAEAGKACALGQREVSELGMVVIDDIDSDFDRRLGVIAGAGGIAAKGKDRADLDGLLREGPAGQRHRHDGSREQPEHMPEFHVIVSKGCARAERAS